jgi:hypothetical protein
VANLLPSALADCPPAPAPTTAELVTLRFEDVTQDGRLVLEALPQGLQPIWRFLARSPPYRVFREQGIAAILTRLVLEGTAGPFSASAPVTAEATFRIVASENGAIHLDMWSTLSARVGPTYDPLVTDPVPPAIAAAGRVFAEHTFTRPFAPPGRRRITAFDFEGAPEVQDRRPALAAPSTLVELPANSRPLDSSLKVDPVPVTFGIVHTDSNMHANSLAYLRIFEEAALRRLVALGRGSKFLGRVLEIAYRKPCFAGQQVRIALQAFERNGRLGAVGVLIDEAQAQLPAAEWVAGARTYVRMGFDP